MQTLSPTFVTCTWGAGGSTFDKTTELSAVAQTVHGLETCMHLTCTNMDRGKVDDALAVRYLVPIDLIRRLLFLSSHFFLFFFFFPAGIIG